jgi:ubiquinone/menaquinone biosynthesis C-methylase UbiE
MNENHSRVCPSPEWAEYLCREVLPAAVGDAELGSDLIEVGPGPGASTEWLRHRVERVVAVEVEPEAADRLAARFPGGNVRVVTADATALPIDDESFDAAASFTMLHHLATAALQNRLLAELLRVLRPGGVLVGSDSLASDALHQFHEGDTYNPVDPAGLLVRLQTLGYERITLTVDYALTFRAYRPRGVDGLQVSGGGPARAELPRSPSGACGW